MPERPTLVVVGAASRDIDATDPRGWRLGGAVSYATLAAARLGIRTRALIGADADAATAHELDLLRDAGAQVDIVRLERGPIFDNRHVGHRRVQHCVQQSDPISTQALPADWQHSSAFLLGPVADELPAAWADAVPAATFVALAWQGLLRDLVPGQPVRARPLRATPLVRRADVLFVSAEDGAAGGVPLADLLRDGQQLFITSGAHGAIHLKRAAGQLTASLVPALPRRTAIDTTGAGDTFLAGYVAARLAAPQLIGSAGEWRLGATAAAAASLSVTGAGLNGAPTLRDLCRELLTPQP